MKVMMKVHLATVYRTGQPNVLLEELSRMTNMSVPSRSLIETFSMLSPDATLYVTVDGS